MQSWLNVYADGFIDFIGHPTRASAENSTRATIFFGGAETLYRIVVRRKFP